MIQSRLGAITGSIMGLIVVVGAAGCGKSNPGPSLKGKTHEQQALNLIKNMDVNGGEDAGETITMDEAFAYFVRQIKYHKVSYADTGWQTKTEGSGNIEVTYGLRNGTMNNQAIPSMVWSWLVNIPKMKIRPRTLNALIYSVDLKKARRKYRCGSQSCLELISPGALQPTTSNTNYDTLPWLSVKQSNGWTELIGAPNIEVSLWLVKTLFALRWLWYHP